jgi:hypothetical protein
MEYEVIAVVNDTFNQTIVVRESAFHPWDAGFDSEKKRVSQYSGEYRGFSPGAAVSSHRESCKGKHN